MREIRLEDLQESVKDKKAFDDIGDYQKIGATYLDLMKRSQPVRIVSPNRSHYVFYQYSEDYGHKITRPLNTHLFFENPDEFTAAFERFMAFLDDLRVHEAAVLKRDSIGEYLETREIDKVIYTVQQAIGCVGDSFSNPNQARKRIGQLFENLIKLIIQLIGMECESRTIVLPVPGYEGYTMSYELDLVFSRNKAILAQETQYIHPHEIVGSVKTTSKDRIDKIFLDKFLLKRLLGRDIPVIAVFLHDVQRARRGNSIFGINSTFKSNHFLGYTVALNPLDGVYYIDLAPEMMANKLLRAEIRDFQRFLVQDLWTLSEIT